MQSKPVHSTPSAKVLVVGQGSVGQVYAHALSRAHVAVHALVRPRHADAVSVERPIHELHLMSATESLTLGGLITHTSPETLRLHRFDHVILTMSSTGLRGAWFGPFVEAIGDTPLTLLQPGPVDRAFALERVPERRLIQGLIGFIAFPAPLPNARGGAAALDGTAFWYPPLSSSMLDGPKAHTDHLVSLLKRGGMPVKRTTTLRARAAMATAVLTPFLIGLELEEWNFEQLRGSGRLKDVSRAEREALELMAQHHRVRRPATGALLQAGVLSMITGVAPIATPFDLETYLQVHFTKVGDQTRDTASTYLELASGLEHPMPALRSMLVELRERSEPDDAPDDTPDDLPEELAAEGLDDPVAPGIKRPRPT